MGDDWQRMRADWREQRREREALAKTLLDIADEWDVVPELLALAELPR
jgi:hypothetical protein